MKLNEMAEKLGLRNLTPEIDMEKAGDVTGGHAADLLSDVLVNAPRGGVLVTIQVHLNVIAVASHVGLAGVIFASNREPEEPLRQKAVEEGIALFVSQEPTFDVVGALYGLGLRGRRS